MSDQLIKTPKPMFSFKIIFSRGDLELKINTILMEEKGVGRWVEQSLRTGRTNYYLMVLPAYLKCSTVLEIRNVNQGVSGTHVILWIKC